MPFRINYTGRAALQTFFRVKPATLLEGTIHDGEENGKEKRMKLRTRMRRMQTMI